MLPSRRGQKIVAKFDDLQKPVEVQQKFTNLFFTPFAGLQNFVIFEKSAIESLQRP